MLDKGAISFPHQSQSRSGLTDGAQASQLLITIAALCSTSDAAYESLEKIAVKNEHNLCNCRMAHPYANAFFIFTIAKFLSGMAEMGHY